MCERCNFIESISLQGGSLDFVLHAYVVRFPNLKWRIRLYTTTEKPRIEKLHLAESICIRNGLRIYCTVVIFFLFNQQMKREKNATMNGRSKLGSQSSTHTENSSWFQITGLFFVIRVFNDILFLFNLVVSLTSASIHNVYTARNKETTHKRHDENFHTHNPKLMFHWSISVIKYISTI